MKHLKLFVFLAVLVTLGMGANSLAAPGKAVGTDTIAFSHHLDTSIYRAVYASYLAVLNYEDIPEYKTDSAINISNCAAAPAEVMDYLGDKRELGTVTVHLWGQDGSHVMHTTGPDSPGTGLDENGELPPGGTWTVLLAEIVEAETGIAPDELNWVGYGWVSANFDCVAGTYNVTIFGLGFTQNFEFLPGMGQGGFFGGIPTSMD